MILDSRRQGARDQHRRMAGDIKDARGQRQTAVAFARLRGMGIESQKRMMTKCLPAAKKLDGTFATSQREMGDRWIQHFGLVEFAAGVSISELRVCVCVCVCGFAVVV